ncbi:cysteine hydrolase [Mycobacterium hodleri]|uniref:Cysteine hydrolase n=2 Tax=Mycolicibacterium hodleri TaxID=49897 RepID=A0A502E4A9_9MYCO|nr:cysteine hydrolase [Mycolicibacterium hodleri]
MHVQPPISDMVADDSWISRIADALAAARGASIPVIHVHIGFREGYPEMARTDARRQQLEGANLFLRELTNASHPKAAPLSGEPVVITSRVGAFTGTDLEQLLSARGISHLVLTGVSTGGVVLGTLIAALERDLNVTVLADACADANPNTHRVLLAHFAEGAPWSATVITSSAWINQLNAT